MIKATKDEMIAMIESAVVGAKESMHALLSELEGNRLGRIPKGKAYDLRDSRHEAEELSCYDSVIALEVKERLLSYLRDDIDNCDKEHAETMVKEIILDEITIKMNVENKMGYTVVTEIENMVKNTTKYSLRFQIRKYANKKKDVLYAPDGDKNATSGNQALSITVTDEDALFLKVTSFSTKHNISISEAVEILDLQQKLVKGKCQAQALEALTDVSCEANEIKEAIQDIAYQVTELREHYELHEQIGG